MGFDFQALAIGGVLIIPLVLGLVEFSKRLGVSGNWCTIEAFVLAAAFGMVAHAVDTGMMPQAAIPWVQMVVVGLGAGIAGLSATGVYDLGKRAMGSWAAYPPDVAHRPGGGR